MADREAYWQAAREERGGRETLRRRVDEGDPRRLGLGGPHPYHHQPDHRWYGYDEPGSYAEAEDPRRLRRRDAYEAFRRAPEPDEAGLYHPEDEGGPGRGDYGWRYSRHGFGPEDYAGRGVSRDAPGPVTEFFGGERGGQIRPERHVQARDQRGRGPKGYRRSDARIQEDVCDWLTDDAWIDASDIEVAVRDGEVTLGGTVTSRNARRRAEDIAESVAGVTYVQNNLRVRERGTGTNPAGMTGDVAVGAGMTGTSATTSDKIMKDLPAGGMSTGRDRH